MIVSCEKMRALEEAAFSSGATADELMENAGEQIARAVRQFFPHPGAAEIFYGKGHNGGDALVAARHLAEAGWSLALHPQENDAQKLSELTREKFGLLHALTNEKKSVVANHAERRPRVILDGLLGIGARGPLRDDIRKLTREINFLRAEKNAHVFAIDLPTGLDGDSGEADRDAVIADFTLTIGFAKRGLVADGAINNVGRLAVLPLEKICEQFSKNKNAKNAAQNFPQYFQKIENENANANHRDDDESRAEIATPQTLAHLLPRRKTESHKTQFGRIGIVAGSVGFTGAALLAATGALHAGAGLVSLYATPDIQPMLAAAAPPEVMVKLVDSLCDVLDSKRDVLAIGPGLGAHRADEVLQILKRCDSPMVVDADAINILSETKSVELLRECAGPRLLTPHPGEMQRIFEMKNLSRAEVVRAFTKRYPVALLLKGARTIIGEKGKAISFNSTGSPGMASGGMGDTLTGVCAALIGQGLSVFDAARLGAWLCGRAAEIAIFNGPHSEESLSATAVAQHLGHAFKQLRDGFF